MEKAHLKFSALCYTAIGFWPIRTKNKAISLFYNYFYFRFCTCLAVSLVLSLLMELWTIKSNVKVLLNNLAIAVSFTFSLVQTHSCTWPIVRSLLREMEVTESKNIIEKETPEVKILFLQELKRHEKLNMVFAMSVLVNDIVYTVTPWIMNYSMDSNHSSKPMLPLESWLPFEKYVYYKTAFIYQFLGAMANTGFTVGSYYFYFGIMQFVLTEFTILKHEVTKGIDHQLNDYEIQDNIRKIVIHHNDIIKFVHQLDKVLRYLMLVGSTIFIGQTAITAFQIITESMSFQLIRNVMLLNAMLSQLFIYYWLANEITLKNSSITDTLWESDWYNCSAGVKKSLLLIMMRSQIPLRLSVGPLYFMNNETMLTILRKSVSYATALRKFHILKTENA